MTVATQCARARRPLLTSPDLGRLDPSLKRWLQYADLFTGARARRQPHEHNPQPEPSLTPTTSIPPRIAGRVPLLRPLRRPVLPVSTFPSYSRAHGRTSPRTKITRGLACAHDRQDVPCMHALACPSLDPPLSQSLPLAHRPLSTKCAHRADMRVC